MAWFRRRKTLEDVSLPVGEVGDVLQPFPVRMQVEPVVEEVDERAAWFARASNHDMSPRWGGRHYCACGWKGPKTEDAGEARAAHLAHRDRAPK